MHHFDYMGGALHAERVSLEALAERFGTPLYVYSHATLTRHVRGLREAFAGHDPLLAYSVKANPNLAVIRTLANEGAGADVVSGGELTRALRAGVPAERIVFSGVGKREDELVAALEAGILCFNVEVEAELDLLSRLAGARGLTAPISLRVNPDVATGAHEYIETGKRINKFGLPLAQARALYARARALPGIAIKGVDCHIGSQIMRAEPFVQALGRVAALARELQDDGIALELIDVGGGLGVRYRDETPPSLTDYAQAVLSQVGGLGARLVLEPGRVITANAGVLVTRVLYRKDVADKRFVIVDGAMNDFARPALYGAQHTVWPVREDTPRVVADMVGPICETGDFLVQDGQVPDAQPGELLAMLGTGAYGRSMASNYNTRPRAAEVLVRGDEAHLIQERETVDELLARERIPDFLV